MSVIRVPEYSVFGSVGIFRCLVFGYPVTEIGVYEYLDASIRVSQGRIFGLSGFLGIWKTAVSQYPGVKGPVSRYTVGGIYMPVGRFLMLCRWYPGGQVFLETGLRVSRYSVSSMCYCSGIGQ